MIASRHLARRRREDGIRPSLAGAWLPVLPDFVLMIGATAAMFASVMPAIFTPRETPMLVAVLFCILFVFVPFMVAMLVSATRAQDSRKGDVP